MKRKTNPSAIHTQGLGGLTGYRTPIPIHVPLRHGRRKLQVDSIGAITKPAIRRIARRGDVKRIRVEIYDTVRGVMKSRITEIMKYITATMELSHKDPNKARKVVRTEDVVFALNRVSVLISSVRHFTDSNGLNWDPRIADQVITVFPV